MVNTFADRLKRLRRERGFTQEELAFEMEVSRSAVANWEKGLRCPSPAVIRRLAVLFGVSSDYLYGKTADRRKTAVFPESETELSELNADGVKILSEIYRLLAADERYRAK